MQTLPMSIIIKLQALFHPTNSSALDAQWRLQLIAYDQVPLRVILRTSDSVPP